jgi:hypothetical protein
MKIITRQTGTSRKEVYGKSYYNAVVQIEVSDVELEDGLTVEDFPEWIVENFPFLVHDVLGYEYPENECNCEDK